VVLASYRVQKPIRLWSVPSSHENDQLSWPDRQTVRCAGDDTELEHNNCDRADFERTWEGSLKTRAKWRRSMAQPWRECMTPSIGSSPSADTLGVERCGAVLCHRPTPIFVRYVTVKSSRTVSIGRGSVARAVRTSFVMGSHLDRFFVVGRTISAASSLPRDESRQPPASSQQDSSGSRPHALSLPRPPRRATRTTPARSARGHAWPRSPRQCSRSS